MKSIKEREQELKEKIKGLKRSKEGMSKESWEFEEEGKPLYNKLKAELKGIQETKGQILKDVKNLECDLDTSDGFLQFKNKKGKFITHEFDKVVNPKELKKKLK